MKISFFDCDWQDGVRSKPRIYLLEVWRREQPQEEPIARLLIERYERIRHDELDRSVYEASICISYERIEPEYRRRAPEKGCFSGSYSCGLIGEPSVSLTSESSHKGAVFLDLQGLQGLGIGTYLMNEIVTWVQQWPNAVVRPVELLEGQSQDENKARRNRFYEQFGLVFDYRDLEHRTGISRPMLAKALTPIKTCQSNLRERDVREFMGITLYDYDCVKFELSQRECAVKDLSDHLRQAEAKPLRWALQQLWWKHYQTISTSVVLGGLATLAWIRYKV